MKGILALFVASAAFAQTVPVIVPGPGGTPPYFQLKQFLELTDAQYAQVFQNIEQYRRTLQSYQQRIFDLQREIAAEFDREQLSSGEIGTRYVEIELNCRAVVEEAKKLYEQNSSLLTAAQKRKLETLNDAIKLLPIISEAQQAAILGPTTSPNPYGSSGIFFNSSSLYVSGCRAPSAGISGGIRLPESGKQ